MADTEKLKEGAKVLKEGINIGAIFGELASEIAEAQRKLDENSIALFEKYVEKPDPDNKSLLDLGFTPAFYRFTDITMSVSLNLKMVIVRDWGFDFNPSGSIGNQNTESKNKNEGEDEKNITSSVESYFDYLFSQLNKDKKEEFENEAKVILKKTYDNINEQKEDEEGEEENNKEGKDNEIVYDNNKSFMELREELLSKENFKDTKEVRDYIKDEESLLIKVIKDKDTSSKEKDDSETYFDYLYQQLKKEEKEDFENKAKELLQQAFNNIDKELSEELKYDNKDSFMESREKLLSNDKLKDSNLPIDYLKKEEEALINILKGKDDQNENETKSGKNWNFEASLDLRYNKSYGMAIDGNASVTAKLIHVGMPAELEEIINENPGAIDFIKDLNKMKKEVSLPTNN
ncbi:MAG TPA: hypothetical protein VK027_08645 [Chitinophagaceae bacterium]|nr:hypothetical protein [Chitinophagaceae bacterium]